MTLDGSGSSSDPPGKALTYAWTQTVGSAVVLNLTDPVRPTFTAPSVGVSGTTLTFALTVSDGTLTSVPDSVNVTVTNVNRPPVADAGVDQTVDEGTVVMLDGSASSDPDGEALNLMWVQTAGPTAMLSDATAPRPMFTAPRVGRTGAVLTFELTVSDGLESRTDTVDVAVRNVNQGPVADAGPDQTVNEGTVVLLNGSVSRDPDSGDPASEALGYAWTQVGGPGVVLDLTDPVRPTFLAPAGGSVLTFELRVSDGEATSAPDTVNIVVNNVNNPLALSPAKLWIGLKNSDAVGLRVDLRAEVFLDGVLVGSGQLDNVPTGSSGFNNALLHSIPFGLDDPVSVESGAELAIQASVRRTCFGGGHNSGTPRLWYNGQPIDSGSSRDAGSRFGSTIGDYFMRDESALDTAAGTARQSVDAPVNSKIPCPGRPFTPFGSWSTTLP